MNVMTKAVRQLSMMASRVTVPRDKRQIYHARQGGFELLVFQNEDVGRQIRLFGTFEPDETRYFSDLIKPDDICFDIGGNVGFFSMLMASLATKGSVHVFEPIPLNAAMITMNAALNDFSNLTINKAAVGTTEGRAAFSVSSDSAYSSLRATGRFAESQSIDVPMMTIDSYVAAHGLPRVDVIKVDVEGAEEMVVLGGKALLRDPERRPRAILLELYDPNLAPFDTSTANIVETMNDYGYRAVVIEPGGGGVRDFMPDMAKRHYNIIFLPA